MSMPKGNSYRLNEVHCKSTLNVNYTIGAGRQSNTKAVDYASLII